MTSADCKALRSAALELAFWAKTLRDSHTTKAADGSLDWGENEAAKRWHDKHLRLVKRLRKIANEEQAKLPAKKVPPR